MQRLLGLYRQLTRGRDNQNGYFGSSGLLLRLFGFFGCFVGVWGGGGEDVL